jgi:very-short-patch-repair endonuclease
MSVERARELRKALTPYEVKVWVRLRELNTQGFRFRRQVPLKGIICDFLCYRSRLIIEIDGMQHGFDANARADAKRDAVLAEEGFLTLRFTNGEVHESLDGVIETIFLRGSERVIAEASP